MTEDKKLREQFSELAHEALEKIKKVKEIVKERVSETGLCKGHVTDEEFDALKLLVEKMIKEHKTLETRIKTLEGKKPAPRKTPVRKAK
ncbi:MAG: hypothetical protein U9N14_01675 [Pseudomonadota bacterium]|nr:hypothetical protein [Pseudomonadota bacterium]